MTSRSFGILRIVRYRFVPWRTLGQLNGGKACQPYECRRLVYAPKNRHSKFLRKVYHLIACVVLKIIYCKLDVYGIFGIFPQFLKSTFGLTPLHAPTISFFLYLRLPGGVAGTVRLQTQPLNLALSCWHHSVNRHHSFLHHHHRCDVTKRLAGSSKFSQRGLLMTHH